MRRISFFLGAFLIILCLEEIRVPLKASDSSIYAAVFDPGYYADRYDDVRAAFGADPDRLLAHFLQYGMAEGRQASAAFDVQYYKAKYEDLRNSFGADMRRYYLHYIHHGKKEGRQGAGICDRQAGEQRITVRGTGGSSAELRFCERDASGNWRTVLRTQAYVGKNGFSANRTQGDKTTPIGTYPLTMAFGIAPDPGCPMGYTRVDDNDYWCGDPASPYYDRFVSRDHGEEFDLKQSEHLIDYSTAYQYCLSIGFNLEQRPNAGAAIFLHCAGNRPYTAGCVAISRREMIALLQMVRPGCVIELSER